MILPINPRLRRWAELTCHFVTKTENADMLCEACAPFAFLLFKSPVMRQFEQQSPQQY
jgi:hypothetical protein